MSELRWDDVRDRFDLASGGGAPDLVISGTTLDHWQALLTLIGSAGWLAEYDHSGGVPDSAAGLFAAGRDGWLRPLRVRPDPDFQLVFRPWTQDEITADLDVFEVDGQPALDRLLTFLRSLSRAVDKPVAIYSGIGDQSPLLTVDRDNAVKLITSGNGHPG